jgi:hypothetical protein
LIINILFKAVTQFIVANTNITITTIIALIVIIIIIIIMDIIIIIIIMDIIIIIMDIIIIIIRVGNFEALEITWARVMVDLIFYKN